MRSLTIFTLAAAISIPALAQTSTKMPSATEIAQRQVKRLTTLLSLTSAQQQQATAIFTNSAKAEQSVREAEKEAHETLRTAIKSNDAATIDQVANAIAQSTAELTSIKAKADAAFYQILAADQQSKLSDLESEHMSPLDGPGGPGGPPPAMGLR